MKIPTLTKLNVSTAQIIWKAHFESAPAGQSTTYRVTTYPGSDLIFVTSWVRGRRIRGERLLEQIRMGLKHAETTA